MLTELEKKIVASIQGDIAVCERPYQPIAEALGISEERLLEILADLCARGVIRRFGATLRHQKSGFNANAMVAWQVAENRIEEVGRTMAAFTAVSHCYCRIPGDGWPYNLYTMVHAQNEPACLATAAEIARVTGLKEYTLLFSRHELKKTSMAYFPEYDPGNL